MDPGDRSTPTVVRVLLVRHAERVDHGAEALTAAGRLDAAGLAEWLNLVPQYTPEAILFSRVSHAREHAGITWGQLTRHVPLIPVTALTPDTDKSEFSFSAMRRETASSVDWGRLHTVLCIGHEERLKNLTKQMTGQTKERLQNAELQVVEADSWEALEEGRGRALNQRHRPPAQPLAGEPDLLPKIRSKVETSTFLAGFTFAVLVVLLTEPEYWTKLAPGRGWPSGVEGWQASAVAAALFFLTLAALLFVVSVYMYDRLSMPQRYWDDRDDRDDRGERGEPPQTSWPGFSKDRARHGQLFAYMVWIWRFVFSAGVFAVMLGFFILVLHRGKWPIAALCLAAIIGAIVYYRAFRPELGVD